MAKMTVLDIVQRVLNKMSSDQTNSITDTFEAKQVANVLKTCYEDIVSEADLGFRGELATLEEVDGDDTPTLLRFPDSFDQVQWINYGDGLDTPEVSFSILAIATEGATGYFNPVYFGENDSTLTGSFIDESLTILEFGELGGSYILMLSSDVEPPSDDAFNTLTFVDHEGVTQVLSSSSGLEDGYPQNDGNPLHKIWAWTATSETNLVNGETYTVTVT